MDSGKEPGKSMPDNFHLWAVLSAFFCFFPTGIIAVSYSNKVGKLWECNREKEAEKAAAKAKVDLEKIKNSVPNGGGSTESLMVDSQIAMLDDPEWRSRVAEEIRGGKNAEWALNDASDFFIRLLESSGDVYLKERAADISDVTKRVLRQMNTKGSDESISPLADLPEDVILVSRNLLPSDTLAMDKRKVKGFVTETGGRTSHTAILARAFELPAVVGIRSLMKEVKTGDRIIVDGIRGVMIVDPTPEREGLYERYRTEWQLRESRLLTLNHLPAETKDGKRILLMANIELPEEADSAVAHGAATPLPRPCHRGRTWIFKQLSAPG